MSALGKLLATSSAVLASEKNPVPIEQDNGSAEGLNEVNGKVKSLPLLNEIQIPRHQTS
jgi:hypothetical protein